MQLLELYCLWVTSTKTHEQAKGLNQRPSQCQSNHVASASAALNKRIIFLTLIFPKRQKKPKKKTLELLKMATFL